MQMNDWFLTRAYSILDSVVPMTFDCGLLCNKKCCKGSADDGMLLLPGEDKFFEDDENFVIKDTPLGKTLICNGNCNRKYRPFACRIFPLFPYVTLSDEKYIISVLKDVRAVNYCPLQEVEINSDFKRCIRLATRNILRDADCASFLLKLTETLTDLGEF